MFAAPDWGFSELLKKSVTNELGRKEIERERQSQRQRKKGEREKKERKKGKKGVKEEGREERIHLNWNPGT